MIKCKQTGISIKGGLYALRLSYSFTTSQLVFQISLGFIPVALIGSIVGGLAGYLGINHIMSLGMRSMGIMKMKMIIPPEMLVILCSVICIFTFLVATLVSTRIRKISAVSLITE